MRFKYFTSFRLLKEKSSMTYSIFNILCNYVFLIDIYIFLFYLLHLSNVCPKIRKYGWLNLMSTSMLPPTRTKFTINRFHCMTPCSAATINIILPFSCTPILATHQHQMPFGTYKFTRTNCATLVKLFALNTVLLSEG